MHLQQGNVILIGELVKIPVSYNFLNSSIDMSVSLVSVQNMVLSHSYEKIAGGYVLHTVSSCYDPLVCEQGCAALVFELATFILSQRYLPRPLSIICNSAANNSTISDKFSSTDLGVMRVGIERVE